MSKFTELVKDRKRCEWVGNGASEKHKAAVARKYEKIEGLRALLATHEAQEKRDHDYERGLRCRIRSAEANLMAMRP